MLTNSSSKSGRRTWTWTPRSRWTPIRPKAVQAQTRMLLVHSPTQIFFKLKKSKSKTVCFCESRQILFPNLRINLAKASFNVLTPMKHKRRRIQKKNLFHGPSRAKIWKGWTRNCTSSMKSSLCSRSTVWFLSRLMPWSRSREPKITRRLLITWKNTWERMTSSTDRCLNLKPGERKRKYSNSSWLMLSSLCVSSSFLSSRGVV